MAGIISTGSIAKALWPGVKGFWGMGYEPTEAEWMMLFDKESSSKHYEEVVQVSKLFRAEYKRLDLEGG